MQEAIVQVAPDSTGKKIRNLQIQILQSDGSFATVLMQVVAITDENGNPVDLTEEDDWRQRMLDETRAVRIDRKSTRLNSSHIQKSRMPSSA